MLSTCVQTATMATNNETDANARTSTATTRTIAPAGSPLQHDFANYMARTKFAGMSTRERVRVMLEWFGRRQTIALPINSVVGCPDCNHSAHNAH
jgi:hypothetical protein